MKYLPRKPLVVATLAHTGNQLIFKRTQSTTPFPRCHRTPETIGLPRREACRNNGELHDLFLKYRHTECSLQHTFDILAWIIDSFLTVTPAQVRMHHIALDRAGPNDRDLDDEIVVAARSEARQHRHLRTRFDLEYTHRIAFADHVVNERILGRHRGRDEGPMPFSCSGRKV